MLRFQKRRRKWDGRVRVAKESTNGGKDTFCFESKCLTLAGFMWLEHSRHDNLPDAEERARNIWLGMAGSRAVVSE
jgi:hypothetical protein